MFFLRVDRLLTWVERLSQLKYLLVQLDILHTGGTPLLLEGLQLLHEQCAAVLHAVHVTHQPCLVGLQLSHLSAAKLCHVCMLADGAMSMQLLQEAEACTALPCKLHLVLEPCLACL